MEEWNTGGKQLKRDYEVGTESCDEAMTSLKAMLHIQMNYVNC